ncbi:MAG: hypothetical protein AAFQ02_12095 [Bacteroidota bacterium]
MPESLIECVLNFSCGRDNALLDQISHRINNRTGLKVAHRDVGKDANRTVYTLIGEPDAVMDAVGIFFEEADDRFVITRHEGEHPMVGIVDVIPVVPIRGITAQALAELLRREAQSWSEKYRVPIIYYGSMATQESARTLAQIRKGGYQGLQERVYKREIQYDILPNSGLGHLGTSCLTTRDFMVAWNVNLTTQDLRIAKSIARQLRQERSIDPSITDVRFLGWEMQEYGCTQISTNVYNINAINLMQLYRRITGVARDHGVDTAGSELIGMVPRKALGPYDVSVEEAIKVLGLNSVQSFVRTERIIDEWISNNLP